MAIAVKRTGSVAADGVKVLVYGQAGAGKTTALATAPAPIILSAEAGLLSLFSQDVPYIEVTSMAQMGEAYEWLTTSAEAKFYQTVCLDSLSEVAEVVLSEERAKTKDPRQAYGSMADQMQQLIRMFRDLPGKNVIMTAKLEKTQDEQGRLLWGPSMPGTKTSQSLPYFFDEVFALQAHPDTEGKIQRALLTMTDGQWVAKDRSGRLDAWETPNLAAIFQKIGGKRD